ncbi:unnamed protein product, partial [Ectocarpus sp. 13 AM-2016]
TLLTPLTPYTLSAATLRFPQQARRHVRKQASKEREREPDKLQPAPPPTRLGAKGTTWPTRTHTTHPRDAQTLVCCRISARPPSKGEGA